MNKIEFNELQKKHDFYNEIVKGNYKKPYINVMPPDIQIVDEILKDDIFKLSTSNWNFPGMEGIRTRVFVCSNGDEVELLVNGESFGRKTAGQRIGYFTSFDVLYQPGILEAINYRNKMEYSREVLQSDY